MWRRPCLCVCFRHFATERTDTDGLLMAAAQQQQRGIGSSSVHASSEIGGSEIRVSLAQSARQIAYSYELVIRAPKFCWPPSEPNHSPHISVPDTYCLHPTLAYPMAPNSPPMWRVFSAEEVAENAERCGSTACALEEGGKEIHLLACAERIHLKRRIFCIDCIDKHHGGWDDLLAALDEPLTADHLRLLESKCSTRGGGGGGGSGGASRKRKARELEPSDDETEDEETERSEYIPSLPATCLASVLNFMLYSDVRKCMLVGKIMPNEVAKHVEALTIDTEAGMDVPAARRFPNVKKVNIACLLKCKVLDKHGYAGRYNLSPLVAPKVVPFLSMFPRLEKCFIGGIAQNTFFLLSPFGVR